MRSRLRLLCRQTRLLIHKTQSLPEAGRVLIPLKLRLIMHRHSVCMNCTTSQDASLASQTQPTQTRTAGLVRSGLQDYQATRSQRQRRLHVRHNSVHKLQISSVLLARARYTTTKHADRKNVLDCYIAKYKCTGKLTKYLKYVGSSSDLLVDFDKVQ